MSDPPKPGQKGERWTGSGWQVYVHRRGKFISHHFPPETPLLTRKAWRNDQKHAKTPEQKSDGSTLAEDVDAYLDAVKSMASYQDRELHMKEWRDALGPYRSRASITPVEIRLELEKRKRKDKLSHGSLNRRRTALMHFYTTLGGKSGYNPVRDVAKYHEDTLPLVLPTLEDAEAAIALIRVVKGKAKTRARARVLLWTGWPPAQLGRLKRDHVNWDAPSAYVTGRRKAKGSKGRWLPLLPKAVEALRAFDAANAWGPFSSSSVHSALAEGCTAAGVPTFNTKALRHLFLTLVALVVKDDRVVSELAMHSKLDMARRYTEQSVDPRLTAALKKFEDSLL